MGIRFLTGITATLLFALSACATGRPMLAGTDASLTPLIAADSITPNTLSVRVPPGTHVAVFEVGAGFPRRVRLVSAMESATVGDRPLHLTLSPPPDPAPVTRLTSGEPARRVARYCIDGPAIDNPTRENPVRTPGYRWGCTWELRPVRADDRRPRDNAPRSYYVVLAFEPARSAEDAARAAAAVRPTGLWYEVADRLATRLFGPEAAARWAATFTR